MACGNPGLWEDFHSRGNANYNFFIETAVHLKQAGFWTEEWGAPQRVRDPATGEYRRTRLFVMTLGYSRKSIRLITFRSACRYGPSCTKPRSDGWAKAFIPPVDIVERQSCDFPSAQTVGDKQQQDRVVPFSQWRPPVNAVKHLPDFVPCDGTWNV
jgi:hypothetical protein